MEIEDKKIQAIIEKLKYEKFEYRNRWERKTNLLYDSVKIYTHGSCVELASRGFLIDLGVWCFRTTVVKESIDTFHCLYIDKNMDFEEIAQRHLRKEGGESDS